MNKDRLKAVQSFQLSANFFTLQFKVKENYGLAGSRFLLCQCWVVSKERLEHLGDSLYFIFYGLHFSHANEEFLDIS